MAQVSLDEILNLHDIFHLERQLVREAHAIEQVLVEAHVYAILAIEAFAERMLHVVGFAVHEETD